eukprot:GEMP01038375.1.p1 GENE.GEMP01038375.1~~GEMP01038375.1.p1  ORF type:complete len:129 (+),score=29.47 GEMP01038375.1:120-506(+)
MEEGLEGETRAVIVAMEEWISSEEFEIALKKEYDKSSRGSGRSDRHIAEDVFMQTCIAMHAHVPPVIQLLIPEPDVEFIDGAVAPILGTNLRVSGIEHMEDFEKGVMAVYVELSHCAALLTQQLRNAV